VLSSSDNVYSVIAKYIQGVQRYLNHIGATMDPLPVGMHQWSCGICWVGEG